MKCNWEEKVVVTRKLTAKVNFFLFFLLFFSFRWILLKDSSLCKDEEGSRECRDNKSNSKKAGTGRGQSIADKNKNKDKNTDKERRESDTGSNTDRGAVSGLVIIPINSNSNNNSNITNNSNVNNSTQTVDNKSKSNEVKVLFKNIFLSDLTRKNSKLCSYVNPHSFFLSLSLRDGVFRSLVILWSR